MGPPVEGERKLILQPRGAGIERVISKRTAQVDERILQ